MPQEVTGMTAYWAVLALSLNAMARPSSVSKTLFDDGDKGKASLIPHLSSPIICLLDCVLELVVLVKVLIKAFRRKSSNALPQPGSSSPSTQERRYEPVAIRLLLFTLGGFPQAIKIYGMHGIPATQAICSIFLASTIFGAISGSHSGWADDEKRELISRLQANRWMQTVKTFVLWFHVIAAFLIWMWVAPNAHLSRTDTNQNFFNLCQWTEVIVVAVCLLATITWVTGVFLAPRFFGRKVRVPLSPFAAAVPCCMLLSYPKRLLEAGDRMEFGEMIIIPFRYLVWDTLYLFLAGAIGSYLVAAALVGISRFLTKTPLNRDSTLRDADAELQSNPESDTRSTAQRGTRQTTASAQDPNPTPLDALLAAGATTLLLPLDEDLKALHASRILPQYSAGRTGHTSHRLPPDTWILVALCFRDFRRAIPPALTRQWKETSRPMRRRLHACVLLLWRIVWISLLQCLWFGLFALARVFDFSPYERLYHRIARTAGPGVVWASFAIFNLMTAIVYYDVAFYGGGTVNPGWPGVLGKRAS